MSKFARDLLERIEVLEDKVKELETQKQETEQADNPEGVEHND